MDASEGEKRDLIIRLCNDHPEYTNKKIAKLAGVSNNTVTNVKKKFQINLSVSRKPGSGAKKGARNKMLDQNIVRVITKHPSMSVRDLARKTKTTKSMVERAKIRNNLRTYKKSKIPKRSVKQFNRGIDLAKNLNKWFNERKDSCIVMDDETYVKMDFSTLPGPQYYIKKKGEELDEAITTIAVEKFGKKRMVWQAICQCGLRSRPYIINGIMNGEIYIKECLQKRLLPFLKKHNSPTIFWPDLASIHYATGTMDFMKANNIEFVSKDCNPPAVPEDRPIEKYWDLVKKELKKEPKAAKNDQEFQYRWKRASARVTEATIQNLMASIREKVNVRRKMNKKFE